jgi:hypothetical protein
MLVYAKEIKAREKSSKKKRFSSTGNQAIKYSQYQYLNLNTSEDESIHLNIQS